MVHAFRGHTGTVMTLLAFKEPEAGRDRLASGGQDWTIRVWDAESGQALHVMQAEGCVERLVGFLSAEGPFCLVSSTNVTRSAYGIRPTGGWCGGWSTSRI
jgi:WD40 repeat protein